MKITHFYIVLLFFVFNVQTDYVYITKTGKKFHIESCNYLKYSSQKIDLKRAKDLGYLSCKVCKPEGLVGEESSQGVSERSIKKRKPSNYKSTTAVQCSGKTKSNRRCKRRTKNSSGRCYQH